MPGTKRYLIILFLSLQALNAQSQDITGTWEGKLGNDQFLQLNIIQNGDKICGYTWDFVKADQRSYCKAYFEGRYDKRQDKWLIEGTSFIENSGTHTLMKLSLTSRFFKRGAVLEGLCINPPSVFSFFFRDENTPFFQKNDDDTVYLRKVAARPAQVLPGMNDCYLKKYQTFNNSKQPDTTATGKKDTVAAAPPPVVIPKDTVTKTPNPFSKRKNTEQSHIEVNVKSITLNVYDNAIVDGDTVSIFYNGKLLLSHQRLSEKPIVLNLELDEQQTRHEIILFAENLGGIPPNTALIVVLAGDKRYELFSSASLEENAVLVFDYVPK